MGKKSRLKRQRRAQRAAFDQALGAGLPSLDFGDQTKPFQQAGDNLRDLFSQYGARDVALALNVSDLWLPNISSQMRHQLAFGVLASMKLETFSSATPLRTYDEFLAFIEQVYAIVPSLPMLEDYIPDPDWGEIRTASMETFKCVFYGASLERVPDYITAFRLLRGIEQPAQTDMDVVIGWQDQVISSIPRIVVGNAEGIAPGEMQVPSEQFWGHCMESLRALSQPAESTSLSRDLTIQIGGFRRFVSYDRFGDAAVTGRSLPAAAIVIDGALIPVSLRNAPSAVIDFWAGKPAVSQPGQLASLNDSVAAFLSERLEQGSFGRLRLATHRTALPFRFAAAFATKRKIYLVCVERVENLVKIGQIEQSVRNLVESGEDWAVLKDGEGGALQFGRPDGRLPAASDIEIVVLPAIVSTYMGLRIPANTNVKIVPMPDFVSIFDALREPDELDRFWEFMNQQQSTLTPLFRDMAGQFAAFRDSHELLVEGAIAPTTILLEPHWASNWRFSELKKFWSAAPPLFPDDSTAWTTEEKSDSPQKLEAKSSPTLAWWTTVGSCVVHVVLRARAQQLDLRNGRFLELFVHCLADSLAQRRELLGHHPLFARERIVISCLADEVTLTSEMDEAPGEEVTGKPLLSDWRIQSDPGSNRLEFLAKVNLSRVYSALERPSDASFETEALVEALRGITQHLGMPLDDGLLADIQATSERRPRFTIQVSRRIVDVPDYSSPHCPAASNYKLARKELAVVFQELGAAPGRYDLSAAKALIDPARDAFRSRIHARIEYLIKPAVLFHCIEEHDALTSKYDREISRIHQSLLHEVSFDRSEAMAKAYDEFSTTARNYRYLLEACLSGPDTGIAPTKIEDLVQIVASIDWLFVLYNASDSLHNDIDVAGLELDHSFVPAVYYSKDRDAREREFALEQAEMKLGLDANPEDRVATNIEAGPSAGLNEAFKKDVGFSFTHLLQMLLVLARWPSAKGDSELCFSYQASPTEIAHTLHDTVEGLTLDEAERIVSFATLGPQEIRRLLGKPVDESDVPVWEHNKRGGRYNIRPLVPIREDLFAWGAAAAERSARIWRGAVAEGYLPADFNWPHVKGIVGQIKDTLELQLETRAFEVCSRSSKWIRHGIDFRRSYPREGIEDVGDFDVLAYWPETNTWLAAECKYNQPPFCLKDARRLRERIFGKDQDRGQFAKIERRRAFLSARSDRLRELLGWPTPSVADSPTFIEIYVSRDIYWWMRNPPYPVPTSFVRIDLLDNWLVSKGLKPDG